MLLVLRLIEPIAAGLSASPGFPDRDHDKTYIIANEERAMSVAKVIEISAESSESFEQAIRSGLEEANNRVRNVEGAWVKEHKVVVKDGKISAFRVDLKVTFVLD